LSKSKFSKLAFVALIVLIAYVTLKAQGA